MHFNSVRCKGFKAYEQFILAIYYKLGQCIAHLAVLFVLYRILTYPCINLLQLFDVLHVNVEISSSAEVVNRDVGMPRRSRGKVTGGHVERLSVTAASDPPPL